MVPAGRIKWKGALVFVPGLLVATACAIVSAQRALPSIGWGDEAELQVLAWQGGLPHCTGYPLYTSIGFLGTRLLASDPARGLSLMSAVFGGSALVLLYLLVLALLRRRDWGAVLLGVLAQGAVGTSDTFTLAASIAEMYTLQWTLTLGVLLLVLTWHESARDSALYGAAFLVGAMFGNHITTVLLLPGLALFIGLALRDPDRRRAIYLAWLPLFAGIVLGYVLPYLVLWHRGLPFDFWHATVLPHREAMGLPEDIEQSAWRSLLFSARCGQASRAIAGASTTEVAYQAERMGLRLLHLPGLTGLVLAVLGAIANRRRRFLLLSAATVLTQSAAVVLETGTRKHAIYAFVPSMIWTLWACVGADWVVRKISVVRLRPWMAFSLAAVATAVLQFVGVFLSPTQAWRQGRGGSQWANTLLARIPTPATVFTDWMGLYPLRYEALRSGRSEGLSLIEAHPESPLEITNVPRNVREVLEAGRHGAVVLSTEPPSGYLSAYKWKNDGAGLWRLQRDDE